MIASTASSSLLKTFAGPECTNISGSTAPSLTTEPSGAKLPFNTAIPPVVYTGSLQGWITSSSRTFIVFAIVPWSTKLTDFALSCKCPCSCKRCITAYTPPAACKSSMKYLPDGDNFANCGVSPAMRLKSSKVKDTPAS